jgi:hypothetical protein
LPQAMATPNIHIGIMAGKLNGVIPATTPSGLTHGIDVNAGAGAFGVFALHQMGHAARKLDHFQAALNVALGVGDDLAVLRRQQDRELLHVLFKQLLELEHDARTALGVHRSPGRLRRLGDGDRLVHFLDAGERDLGLDLACIGIIDIAKAV